MGDVDDSDVAGAKTPQRLEQSFDVGLGKRRGRLIENDDVGFDRERPADRDQRAFGRGKRRDRRLRVEIAAHARERLGRRVAHAPPGNEAGPRARIAGLNRDVLGHRHPLDEAQILVDEGDRQGVRPRMDGLSGEPDLARVGAVDSGQDFYQRGLAGAVLAEQRVDLAAADVEIDMIERQRRREALDEPGHGEKRRGPAVRTGLVNGVHDRSSRTVTASRITGNTLISRASRRRRASPPPLWGRDRVGGRAMPKQLGRPSRGPALRRNAISAPAILLRFPFGAPPHPGPPPQGGRECARPFYSPRSADGRCRTRNDEGYFTPQISR